MRPHVLSLTATSLVLSGIALGQTSTGCNPLNTTCLADAALGKNISVDFTQGESSEFTVADGSTITYGTNGAEFVITSDGTARTIASNNYIFFGKVEIMMKAANGTGIVSSFVMESDDLDEIDWEWLGGNATVVETNYFGKGNTTTYNRATYVTIDNPQDNWHTYTIDWASDYIKWYVDGGLVRTLLYADALDGQNFPQTPMRIKIGNWDGGAADESEGTVEWAGGYTDLDDAPFAMYVKNITIEDYTTSGTTYSYGDETGSYTSIVVSNNATETNTTLSSNWTIATSSGSNSSTSASASSPSSTTNSSPAASRSVALASRAMLGAEPHSSTILVLGLGLGVLYL